MAAYPDFQKPASVKKSKYAHTQNKAIQLKNSVEDKVVKYPNAIET